MPEGENNPFGDLVTSRAIADEWGVNRSTVKRWVDAGLITPAVSTPNIFLFRPEDVEELRRIKPPQPKEQTA